VNTSTPTEVSTPEADISLLVRVKDFRSSPDSSSPPTCQYFDHPQRHGARYSISWRLKPRKNINGDDLLLGNTFDEPIRDQLPHFFGTALGFVKRYIDPGLEGDAYADKPYLLGSMLSSVNAFRIGNAQGGEKDEEVMEEGATTEDGKSIREKLSIPDDSTARQKHFLAEEHRKAFEFEAGKTYEFDFFNGYLDFNEFALKLPMGLSFNILRQLGGENVQPLRYVLKDRETGNVLFHVTFTLIPEKHDEDETSKDSEEVDDPELD